MPKWLKLALILGGVMLGLVALCIGGGVYWFNSNKDQFKALGDQSKKEGEAFGRTTDDRGCSDESVRRLDAASGLMGEVAVKVFFGACLDAAQRTPEFCDGVPSKDEIMSSATWAIDVCTSRPTRDAQACGRVMQAVQEQCAKRR